MKLLHGLILLSVLIIETLGVCDNPPRNDKQCEDNDYYKNPECKKFNFDWNKAPDHTVKDMSKYEWKCEPYYKISTNVNLDGPNTYWITWTSTERINGEIREIHSHISAQQGEYENYKEQGSNAFKADMALIKQSKVEKIANVHLKNGVNQPNTWLVHPKEECKYNHPASFNNLIESLKHYEEKMDHQKLLKKLKDAYDLTWAETHNNNAEGSAHQSDLRPTSINANMENAYDNLNIQAIQAGNIDFKLKSELSKKTKSIKGKERNIPFIFVDKEVLQSKLQLAKCYKRSQKDIECTIENIEAVRVLGLRSSQFTVKNIQMEVLKANVVFLVREKISNFVEYEIVEPTSYDEL